MVMAAPVLAGGAAVAGCAIGCAAGYISASKRQEKQEKLDRRRHRRMIEQKAKARGMLPKKGPLSNGMISNMEICLERQCGVAERANSRGLPMDYHRFQQDNGGVNAKQVDFEWHQLQQMRRKQGNNAKEREEAVRMNNLRAAHNRGRGGLRAALEKSRC